MPSIPSILAVSLFLKSISGHFKGQMFKMCVFSVFDKLWQLEILTSTIHQHLSCSCQHGNRDRNLNFIISIIVRRLQWFAKWSEQFCDRCLQDVTGHGHIHQAPSKENVQSHLLSPHSVTWKKTKLDLCKLLVYLALLESLMVNALNHHHKYARGVICENVITGLIYSSGRGGKLHGPLQNSQIQSLRGPNETGSKPDVLVYWKCDLSFSSFSFNNFYRLELQLVFSWYLVCQCENIYVVSKAWLLRT